MVTCYGRHSNENYVADLEEALVINSHRTVSHGAEMNRLEEICPIGFFLTRALHSLEQN